MARKIARVQEILFPVLRPLFPGVTFTSWVPDVDQRTYPTVNIRRLGGTARDVKKLDRAVVEMTAFGNVDLPTTENLFLDIREAIWDMVQNQTVVPGVGSLCSFFETFGPTPFDSPYNDTWRIQNLMQLGIRPPRES